MLDDGERACVVCAVPLSRSLFRLLFVVLVSLSFVFIRDETRGKKACPLQHVLLAAVPRSLSRFCIFSIMIYFAFVYKTRGGNIRREKRVTSSRGETIFLVLTLTSILFHVFATTRLSMYFYTSVNTFRTTAKKLTLYYVYVLYSSW